MKWMDNKLHSSQSSSVEEYHINKEGKDILLIDLAMPRDIPHSLKVMKEYSFRY